MKRNLILIGGLLLLITALVAAYHGPAQAQQPQQAGYTLNWWTIDGGGGDSAGSGYTLGGTIGQPDAGLLSNGGYTLAGGFWGGGALAAATYAIYLPLIIK